MLDPSKSTQNTAAPQPGRNDAERVRYLNPQTLAPPPSAGERWGPALASVTVGAGFFFLGALFDVVLQQHGIGAPAILWGDLLAGVVAGLLVLFYEQRRRRELIQQLSVIQLMNHHVRNSLQVISYASSAEDREQHVKKVREAIERIDWALREVLTGRNSSQ